MNLRSSVLVLILFGTSVPAFADRAQLPNLNSAVYCKLTDHYLKCTDAQQVNVMSQSQYIYGDEAAIIVALREAGLKLKAQYKDMSTVVSTFLRD